MGRVPAKRRDPSKKWSRHLRIFSFDAEVLMGGSFSIVHDANPSIHSIAEEVASPHRDDVSPSQLRSNVRMATSMTSTTPDPFRRHDLTATPPPPYPAVAGACLTG